MSGIVIRRSGERFRTEADGITTLHSFSYGRHYDPENVAFGPVIALNEECIQPGGGYDQHRHADVAIHTLVLEGALAHDDSRGRRYVLEPGTIASVSAGEGIEHSERNASTTEPLRFLQVMTREVPVDVRLVRGACRVDGPALVHVIRGELTLDGQALGPGDEARLSGPGPYDLNAAADAEALMCQE